MVMALSAARAGDIGQALPREGGSDALDHLAPHVAVNLTGPWLPPFGDFHTRLGARLALDFSFQPGAPGVLASTRGMPDSTLRNLICGIQDGGGAQHLLPLLGASNVSNPPSVFPTVFVAALRFQVPFKEAATPFNQTVDVPGPSCEIIKTWRFGQDELV